MRGVLTVQGTATTPTVTTTVTPIVDPLPTPIATGDIMVRLEPVAAGLTAPNWGISAPGDTRRLFVVDQNGLLWAIDTITGARTIFADLSSLLVRLGIRGPGSYDERGFLGVAFHPDYATNGLLYTYTSEPAKPNPDFTTLPGDVTPDHENVVREWRVRNPRDPHSIVDAGSSRMLFRSHHPAFNHNAGALSFGPDKMLYIATGDGGNADDEGPGHALEGNAQRLDNILGKILRINPLLRTSRNGQYGIPTDNPFVTRAGALGEIYAYGFRNPFRFSFDSVTGSLYVADVGQNKIEEVNIVEKGRDYGWRLKEGTFLFSPNGDAPGFVYRNSPGQPAGLRDPVAQYDHDEGIAVVGGFVYHGTAIPALRGRYVFGDFAKTFTSNGRVFYLTEDNQIAELRLQGMADPGIKIDGFGQDANGELYVLGNTTGTPSGTTGVVLRLAVTEYRVYLPLIFNSARVGGVRSTP
jgi:glucose/arabinose dehydrogenase